ncbi:MULTISPECIES: ABC transporter ATP-binding protein [Bacillales]|uniref:ABC transporter ATP-binding protein n=1 Tax=Brevibacillus aydinogluensis TaxID=927786 RepID=A0AA48MCT8_9BACL|nr:MULTISPECIES: ABC transporter ATP-binding protein [Bacillales]NNV02348.1 ABC transporter ATP-binding protein [Brevibacillus sp. MCWH]REK66866.1 MAG: ABC transporter ATP-binding protein [Brevibacillus sp.]MDT3416405.1 branched-chain amino acid transport system ATP-binding protein [Brevibacillus aydinogluensis]UFJ62729.1 ABC transporter ATP-binding protein [Anoxybacillus sediminis]CAJ1004141.1 ABC transporter ATP-binding protein [Brevibacillus aydinogluensis]
MLHIDMLNVWYGSIHAVRDLSLSVEEGEVVTLIGSNGAGKTTTLNAICGVLPAKGSIRYGGNELNGVPTHRIVQEGIVMVPEGRRVFPRLTVADNLMMGAYSRRASKAELEREMESVFELFPRLAERKDQLAGTMSGGEQQMLAIGRALMAKPRLLILDEPSMGLAPIVVKDIFQTIRQIKRQGMTILLVEQNATMALSVADRGYVLEHGEIRFHGTAEELKEQGIVKKAYLGG